MKCLFVASECYPFIKTGGLADVAGALPAALAEQGCDVQVLLPGYPAVLEKLRRRRKAAEFPDLFGDAATLTRAKGDNGLTYLILEAPKLFDRPGNPYLGPNGKDWPDNAKRFAAFSWIAAEIALGRCGRWAPDIVHLHDWQAALTAAYLEFAEAPRPRTVCTIHNLAFQGVFPSRLLRPLDLPRTAFVHDGLEYFGDISFLKAGLVYSDAVTTVSPTYAWEIQTEKGGMGLGGVLRSRAKSVHGILNGVDETVWNPETDPLIAANYSRRSAKNKARNKSALQDRFGLQTKRNALLFAVVSRLTEQKGLDLLVPSLAHLVWRGGQIAMLGSGEPGLEDAFADATRQYPGQIGVEIGYDEPLSHLMQAGADAILVPSRFEPCGLTQLYGLRYGTLPIVARVGGLADTVIDANEAALKDGVATGFQFSPVTADAFRFALDRAFDVFQDRRQWNAMRRRAMAQNVGWRDPAAAYIQLYQSLLSAD